MPGVTHCYFNFSHCKFFISRMTIWLICILASSSWLKFSILLCNYMTILIMFILITMSDNSSLFLLWFVSQVCFVFSFLFSGFDSLGVFYWYVWKIFNGMFSSHCVWKILGVIWVSGYFLSQENSLLLPSSREKW